jgi:hypothetical protein
MRPAESDSATERPKQATEAPESRRPLGATNGRLRKRSARDRCGRKGALAGPRSVELLSTHEARHRALTPRLALRVETTPPPPALPGDEGSTAGPAASALNTHGATPTYRLSAVLVWRTVNESEATEVAEARPRRLRSLGYATLAEQWLRQAF